MPFLVLPIFSYSYVRGFVSQQGEVLGGMRSLCGRIFIFTKNQKKKKRRKRL